MADEEPAWDAEDFNPDSGFQQKSTGDRWTGEDEHLNKVKEDWTESDEERKNAEKEPKKPKAERIEERKAQRRKEQDAAQAVADGEVSAAEEKKRKELLQKQADLETARELFGASAMPQSSEDFAQLGRTLAQQLLKFETQAGYSGLLENLIRDSCVPLDAEDLRKMSAMLSSLAQEKQKLAKVKIQPKKKGGKNLRTGKGVARRDDFDLEGTDGAPAYDEEYDFM